MGRTQLRVEVLEDRSVPVTLPSGFAESVFASGLTNPTQMAVAPDGRVFVAEQGGTLRVIQNGALLPTPFLSLSVDSTGERGLVGVALDPNFATNGFVYVYHTVAAVGGAAPFNQVSRFTANGNVAVPGSEVDILSLDPLSSATNHNGGPLQFGPDGKLYVAVGENNNGPNAQSLTNRLGKVLRINPDGSIPADNPTAFDGLSGTTSGANRAIWAVGLRNPFELAFQPGTGRLFINDVGQGSFEEIDDGRAGANYGWPNVEGPSPPGVAGVTYPLDSYPHNGTQPFTGIAITGGTFYNPPAAQFPTGFVGSYFFTDLTAGWIDRFDPATGAVSNLATDLTGQLVTDLDVGPSGQLLYLARGPGSGAVYQVTFTPQSGPPPVSIAVGSGAGSAVAKLVDPTGTPQQTVTAFDPAFQGGARVAAADVTGDGVPDLVVGAGPGGSPRVRVFDGATGSPVRDLFAFEQSFTGGVYVAAADLNRDGFADLIVSADQFGGPRVVVFSGKDGSQLASFFGIDDNAFRGGARVAAGDINGDGTPDVVVAAGILGGPRVAVFDGRSLLPGQMPAKLVNDFFAFEDTVRNGVFVAVGDVNGDTSGDVIVGGGPGGGPRVVVFDGKMLLSNPAAPPVASFFSGDPAGRSGVTVAARDTDGDGKAEVITGTAPLLSFAPGAAPVVTLYTVVGGSASQVRTFAALDPSTDGIFVG
jgi:glucose/arabinose dehydrogenase